MNEERFEQLLRAEMNACHAPDPSLDNAVKRRLLEAGKSSPNWLALFLVCANLLILIPESLLMYIVLGGTATAVLVFIHISILNLTTSFCILKRKTEQVKLR